MNSPKTECLLQRSNASGCINCTLWWLVTKVMDSRIHFLLQAISSSCISLGQIKFVFLKKWMKVSRHAFILYSSVSLWPSWISGNGNRIAKKTLANDSRNALSNCARKKRHHTRTWMTSRTAVTDIINDQSPLQQYVICYGDWTLDSALVSCHVKPLAMSHDPLLLSSTAQTSQSNLKWIHQLPLIIVRDKMSRRWQPQTLYIFTFRADAIQQFGQLCMRHRLL